MHRRPYCLYPVIMRTLAGILLGIWLAGTCIVAWVAAENFFMIDRLIDQPTNAAFAAAVDKLPGGEARLTLRYLSSELNRQFFSVFGWIGLGLGFALLGIAPSLGSRQVKIGFALMTLISLVMALYLTPQIVNLGRELDFVVPGGNAPVRAAFGRLHGSYSSLELLKLSLGLWMCVALIRGGSRR